MREHRNHCCYCRNDREGSWERISRSAKDPGRTWVCCAPDNDYSMAKAIFCLSNGHLNRPEACETRGQILLSLMRNESREFWAIAIERKASPDILIPENKKYFTKILKPMTPGLLLNREPIYVDETILGDTGNTGSRHVEVRILRDSSIGYQEIASLEKTGNWTLDGRTDIERLTVESI